MFFFFNNMLLQSVFCFFNQNSECCFVEYCDISKDFMIDFDRCFFQIVDEMVVRQIILMSCCVDMCNLQLMELMFFSVMVMVSVLISFNNCLECYMINM